LAPALASAAPPGPGFSIRTVTQPTNFSSANDTVCEYSVEHSGSLKVCDSYVLIVTNVGGGPTRAGAPVTISDTLPPGVHPVRISGLDTQTEGLLGCSTAPLQCNVGSVPAGDTLVATIYVTVEAGAEVPGALNLASVEGGGAPAATSALPTAFGSKPAPFRIEDFALEALDASGSPSAQAGGHPSTLATSLYFSSENTPPLNGPIADHASEEVKDVIVDLPPGFFGNPQSTPKCPQSELTQNSGVTACLPASRVGTVVFEASPGAFITSEAPHSETTAVYNLAPEPGFPAEFGFTYLGKAVFMYASAVRIGGQLRLRVTAPGIPELETVGTTLLFYGDPGAHFGGPSSPTPFFTNSADCAAGPLSATTAVDTWQHPGAYHSAESISYPEVTGCAALSFEPTFTFTPDTPQADSPTGTAVDLKVPQALPDPETPATPPLRDATVTLPAGLEVNPSSADGLQGCAPEGPNGINIGSEEVTPQGQDLGDPEATELGAGHLGGNGSPYDDGLYHTAPGHCPQASQIGTVEVSTPLLEAPLHGRVYLGAPDCGPCTDADAQEGRLLKLYIEAEGSGVIVKLPGTVSANPSTGQLTATFKDNPQLPFSDLKLRFKSGPRAPLRTPSTCGRYTTTTDLVPWSAPQTPDATPSSSFAIASAPNGQSCTTDPTKLPLNPSFEGGTVNPLAGAFSPFVTNLRREDGQQEISSLHVTTPPGIAADLRGVPYCADGALSLAASHSGAVERANPLCPAQSQIGTVNVGAGAGPNPFYVSGRVYLAGPYKGAPLSLAILTPAVAGPFDLGTVVVRAAAYVDPTDAHLHVVSDPLPRILDGIPLDIRDVRVAIDRPDFTTNPTYCGPMSLYADLFGFFGAAIRLTNHFQVGGCEALGFKPKLAIRLKGGTHRNDNPALSATLTARPGDANIARAQVTLPHSEFLDQAHIKTVCTRVQFSANQCPAASIYGYARAMTPLLDRPLEGPVYLRSSSNKLPDLVAALGGQIQVALDGRVDTGKSGGLRNSFEVVPDAPVSKFTLSMQGGKKGLLVNSEDLCGPKAKTHATVLLDGQNGKTYDTNPVVANSCKARGKKHRGKK
jgi:hypothetical protein